MRRAGAALLALVAAGCSALPGPWRLPHLGDCPGGLVSTAALAPGDFALRERLRVVGGDVDAGFEVVAERRGDRLVVVGFNAFGAKAFAAIQEGDAVEARSFLGRALPVDPANVLRDLHAAGRFAPDAPPRAAIARPGCGYTATFAAVSRTPID